MSDELDLAALLAITPSEYLKGGLFASPGVVRPELFGTPAMAIGTQLERDGASPEEVAATFEALRQIVEQHDGAAASWFERAVDESLALVENMLGITNNIMIEGWLRECVPFVHSKDDADAFLEHFQAVTRQYAALIAVKHGRNPDATGPTDGQTNS